MKALSNSALKLVIGGIGGGDGDDGDPKKKTSAEAKPAPIKKEESLIPKDPTATP